VGSAWCDRPPTVVAAGGLFLEGIGVPAPPAGRVGSKAGEVSMPEDPFRLVVLGDSIQWGQGLPEESKFSELVRARIEIELPRPAVLVHRYAHSGASIGSAGDGLDVQGKPTASPFDPGALLGELPNGVPTVHAQLSALLLDSVIDRNSIDLVLLDGGINPDSPASPDGSDPFSKALNPLTHIDDLRGDANKACATRMGGLLERIAAGLPNARVVVTGYYPIFSHASLMPLAIPWLQAAVAQFPLFTLVEGLLLERLSALSTAWAEASAAALRTAVDKANAGLGGPPRFGYAHVPFAPQNCLFAPRSWLWGLSPLLQAEDSIAQARLLLAQEQARAKDPFSVWASVGHPNQSGTVQYAQAIISTLRDLGVLPAVPPGLAGWWARIRAYVDRVRRGGAG
jgi:hypothetical protein